METEKMCHGPRMRATQLGIERDVESTDSSGAMQASPGWPAFAGHDSEDLAQGPAQIVQLARGWIGTPYLHQASVKGAGCDCLGLLRGVWREMGRGEPEELPNYAPDWDEAARHETLYMGLKRHFREAPVVEPGVIALFRMAPRGPAKHCGIVAERDGAPTLIHARQNKRVSEELLSAFWRKKLAYAFRL